MTKDDHNPALTYGLAFVRLLIGAGVFGAFIGSKPELGFFTNGRIISGGSKMVIRAQR
jgi:hypothetical protein